MSLELRKLYSERVLTERGTSEQKGTASSLESSQRIRLLISSGPVAFPVLRDLRIDSISSGLKCKE